MEEDTEKEAEPHQQTKHNIADQDTDEKDYLQEYNQRVESLGREVVETGRSLEKYFNDPQSYGLAHHLLNLRLIFEDLMELMDELCPGE